MALCVEHHFKKMTFSKGALILNNLLPEALKSSYIKTWYEDWHVLFLLHD